MSLSAKDVLAGVLAVQRGLIRAEELSEALAAETPLRERLPGAWAELAIEADGRLNAEHPWPADVPTADLAQYDTPEARYAIGRHLGQSGASVVWLADDGKMGRQVALKTLRDGSPHDETVTVRFLRAASHLASLRHPGVVPVFDHGVFADGRPFLVMPVVEGMALSDVIRDYFHESASRDAGEDDRTIRKLMQRFVEVCNAVEYAHSEGVIHRDVKPANVILRPAGAVLVGWSLARRLTDAPEESGRVMGTPAYLSPEQASGANDRVGPRSDVYLLGATLYEMLTGRPPRLNQDVGLTLDAAAYGEVVAAKKVAKGVPADLNAICMKALASDPQKRYESAKALAEDVERWLADAPVDARQEPVSAQARRWARRHQFLVGITVTFLTLPVAIVSLVREAEKNRTEAALRIHELEAQQEDLADRLGLAELDNLQFRETAAQMHNEAGRRLLEEGKHQEAREQFDHACELYRRLAKKPSVSDTLFTYALAVTLNNVGDVQRQTGQHDEAIQSHDEARELLEGLNMVRAADRYAELARTYAALAELEKDESRRAGWRIKRLDALLRTKERRQTAQGAAELPRSKLTAEQQYDVACLLAQCASAVSGDEDRPLPEREKSAEAWSRQAVELLRAAQKSGYFVDEAKREALKIDPDLDGLRERDDFKRWLDGL